MLQKTIYAMLETSLNDFLKVSGEIMETKKGMTASDMKVAIEEIYAATTINRTPVSKEDFTNLYKIDDSGNAIIPIIGVLTPKVNPCAGLFGGAETEYGYIKAAVQKANTDPYVDKIEFHIDSPGGYVDGVDEAAEVIATAEKPTISIVHNMAASAAYWLASQTDHIIASSRTVLAGSIGVAAEITDYSEQDKKHGVKTYVFTSTEAPEKRLDYKTEDGQEKIIARLDDTHNVFIARVANGRGITAEVVNKTFGRGGVLIAEKALKAGMIDGIIDYEKNKNSNSPQLRDKISTEENMDKAKLKADFPDLYEEIKNEGKESVKMDESLAQDRERSAKILKLAGVNDSVIDDVKNGMTEGDFAIKEVENLRKAKAENKSKGVENLAAVGQLPTDTKPETPEAVENKKEDDAVQAYIDSKKGVK